MAASILIKWALGLFFVVMLAISVFLGYQNFASPKIKANIVTAAFVGTLGVLLTIWFSLEDARRDETKSSSPGSFTRKNPKCRSNVTRLLR